jgi:asparagine synthase (glutamine-hydrolysing)
MSERIAHRGPDDHGLWTDPGVALAHRRLSIIDLTPEGHQPMLSSCGRYTIVFNGEIYNYLELRRELEDVGERFSSGSDTEVLLVAFRRWGESALPRLNGMWAFAIWDSHERSLFASRDRFGKKPFYYVVRPREFLFASEIKALLLDPQLVTRPSASAVADFCAERVSNHGSGTFFEDVRQLPAGSVLRWRDGVLSVSRYWSLTITEQGDYVEPDVDHIHELLRSAVALRLRADTPVGALLSGGLDSSVATSFASEMQAAGNPLHIFSTVHDPPYEEADGIAAVRAKHPDLAAHFEMPTADGFWDDLSETLWHQEQPFGDASMVAHFRLMRLARQAGVPVLLSGQGADEVFAGYPGYLWIYLGSRLRMGQLSEFVSYWRHLARYQEVPLRNVLLNVLPVPVARMAKRMAGRGTLGWLAPEYRPLSDSIFHGNSARGADPLDQALLQSLTVRTLPGFLHYEDRNSMAFGVETRLPFLDYRLVEYLFRIQPGSKLSGGVTKSLLRDAAKGAIPDSIRLRTRKMGYPAPLLQWLRAKPEKLLDAADAAHLCPLLNPTVWAGAVRHFLKGDDRQLDTVWRGYILSQWHAAFFSGKAAA